MPLKVVKQTNPFIDYQTHTIDGAACIVSRKSNRRRHRSCSCTKMAVEYFPPQRFIGKPKDNTPSRATFKVVFGLWVGEDLHSQKQTQVYLRWSVVIVR